MSLDFYLYSQHEPVDADVEGARIFVREGGRMVELTRSEWDERYPDLEPTTFVAPLAPQDDEGRYLVYHANITHNMADMAKSCGLWEPLWRPHENGYERAGDLVEPIAEGIGRLMEDPDEMQKLNPSNGWGSFDALLEFARSTMAACQVYQDAHIKTWV